MPGKDARTERRHAVPCFMNRKGCVVSAPRAGIAKLGDGKGRGVESA